MSHKTHLGLADAITAELVHFGRVIKKIGGQIS